MRIIIFIIKWLSFFIPKKNNRVCFKSFPDYAGNSLAMYEYLNDAHKDKYELIWLTNECESDTIFSVKAKTIKGLWFFFTSKYVFTTHNDFVSISPINQVYISLWHGMPIKKIGFIGNEYGGMKSVSAKRISTSELTRSIISSSFNEPANNVYITGQPVCDTLFNECVRSQLDVAVKKIVVYLPTFRQDFNESRIEGRVVSEGNIFRLDYYNHDDFINYLERNKIMFIVKLHPAEECFLSQVKQSSYFKIIHSNGNDLYEKLAMSDCLLTDYSSVYIDYLVLNRPIGFVIPDIDAYSKSRDGFTLEPYDFWASGRKIKSDVELYSFLDDLLEDRDVYRAHREKVINILHRYRDGRNAERVFNCFMLKK